MSGAKVSVVVPVYNVEEYLRECLDSLKNQSLRDIEIICVNDGSKDSSLEILEEYGENDSRFQIISQENRGLSGARNTAMKHITGEYVFFLDSDDYLKENALEEIYSYSKALDLDICLSQFINYLQDSNSFEENYYSRGNLLNDYPEGFVFNFKELSDSFLKIPHCTINKMIRCSFLEAIDAEFPQGLNYEDIVYFFRVFFKAQRISLLKKPLYYYRIRQESISTAGGEKSFDIFEVLKIAQNTLKDLGIYEDVFQGFLMFVIVNLKFVYLRLKEDLRDEYFREMKKQYHSFNLDRFIITNQCHFDDQAFYRAIEAASNGKEFELAYKKLYYEFLANHYQGLCRALEMENTDLKRQLENSSLKRKFKNILGKNHEN